jgi:hypothetical protein
MHIYYTFVAQVSNINIEILYWLGYFRGDNITKLLMHKFQLEFLQNIFIIIIVKVSLGEKKYLFIYYLIILIV